MLEAYQAFGDYETMMDLTERLFTNAIAAIGGGYKRPWGETEIDFSPPFSRRPYMELLEEHTGVDAGDDAAILKYAEGMGLNTAGMHPDVVRNKIFEERVEDTLVGPVFVIDYPASICPLTKRKRDNPAIAERFELFVHGMELANAYTELNDPDLQEQLFLTQLEGQDEEDSMAKMDHDFVRALKHGIAAGWRTGSRHRPNGDALDQFTVHPRRDSVPRAAPPQQLEKRICHLSFVI